MMKVEELSFRKIGADIKQALGLMDFLRKIIGFRFIKVRIPRAESVLSPSYIIKALKELLGSKEGCHKT